MSASFLIGSSAPIRAFKFTGYKAQTAHASVESERRQHLAPPSHGSYAMKLAGPFAIALSCLCFHAGMALADDTSQPKTTATRPAKELPGQTSLPSSAPAATRTQPTESTDQSPTVKQMNEEAHKKLEIEGK